MKNAIYFILVAVVALALRLYPYAISGMPFSNDAWPLIRNAELLAEQTPIALNDKIFDGYNNFWPAISLFGVVVSETTSLSPLEAMAFFLPVTGAITILIFYVLVKRLYNAEISFIASIIFGTAFTHAYFTAGVTKETYANPLYMLLILIFLHPAMDWKKRVLLFTIAAVTSVLAHHFTSLVTIFILSSITLAGFVGNVTKRSVSHKRDFLLVLILMATAFLYYGLFAQAGFKMPLTYNEWLSVASYQLILLSIATYLTSRSSAYTRKQTVIAVLATVASVLLYVILTLKESILPGLTTTVQNHVLLYISPYFITVPVIILGHIYQKRSNTSPASLFWLTTILGLQAYALFSGSNESIGIWIRAPNFQYPPLAILSAMGFYWLFKATKTRVRMFIKPAVIATLLIIATINIYSLYSAVSLQDRYMGYHWLYRVQEYRAGAWIARNAINATVAGDIKVSYLVKGYFDVDVDVFQGLRYLTENNQNPPEILYVYSQMLKNGYVFGLHGVDLSENWTDKTSQLDFIYSNGLASLYAG